MKHFFSFLAVCLMTAACGIPRIALDTSYKGDRVTLTSDAGLFAFQDGMMSIALGSKITGRDTVLAVLVTYDGNASKGIFDKEDRFMIRLGDGSEISMTNLYDREFESRTETNTTQTMKTDYALAYTYSPWTDSIYLDPITVSRWVPKVYTVKITNSYGLYLLSKGQLDAIMKKGIKKIRIESNLGDADMTDTDKAADVFKNLYECLHKNIKKAKINTKF